MSGALLGDDLAAVGDAIRAAESGRTEAEQTLERGRGTLNRLDAQSAAAAERGREADARAAQRALATRLKLSRITVDYRSVLPVRTDRGHPLAEAWAQAGEDFATSAALLLTMLVNLAPFGALGLLTWLGWRRLEAKRLPSGA